MHYVVDTSVFLSDPKALEKLSDKQVVIPLAVLMELEAKRNHPELGYPARETLRTLEKYRKMHGNVTEEFPTSNSGTLLVEPNHIQDANLPDAFKTDVNDNRILAVAANLRDEGTEVTLLTQDLPLRLRASVADLAADEWGEDTATKGPQGLATVSVDSECIDSIYANNSLFLPELLEYPVNTGFVLKSPGGSALARLDSSGTAQLIRGDKTLFEVRGRSAEQRIALDLLGDDSVGIVSLGGPAGTGKSLLAIAAGLEAVLERNKQKKVIVFRPLYAVGGQDLGYLPGTAEEKMSPWAAAVIDALEAFCGPDVIEEVVSRKLLEVLPLTHIRGRTLTDSFVIVDECQNLERMVLLTALTRLGSGSRIVLTHDVSQRDNLRVGKHDGISSVIGKLSGHELFGHVSLTKSERSPIAQLVADLLED